MRVRRLLDHRVGGSRVPHKLISADPELIKRLREDPSVSAVYGSDAVSGVVNFITDKRFNGVTAHARYGISQRSDDKAPDFGVAAGTDLFGGRGHIEGS
jgi:outer membrane receptor protein involved in Fe transport